MHALAVAQRVPLIRRLLSVAIWLGCGLLLVGFVDQMTALDPRLGRVADTLRLERQDVVGRQTRIAMAPDGQFWVHATLNGREARMLVDSGASMTTLSRRTATAVGLEPRRSLFPVLLATGNGTTLAKVSRITELRLGNIVARNMTALVAPNMGSMDVVGMNFLSRLKGWRVEGHSLVLTPHHPTGERNDQTLGSLDSGAAS